MKAEVDESLRAYSGKVLYEVRHYILKICLLIFVSNEFSTLLSSSDVPHLNIRRLAFILGCMICPKQMMNYITKPLSYSKKHLSDLKDIIKDLLRHSRYPKDVLTVFSDD